MHFTVYILKSIEGHSKIGQTSDLLTRMHEHNSHLSHSTKHDSDWKVIHSEKYSTRSEAMRREKYFKSGKGREELKRLNDGVESASADSSSGS